MRCAGTPRRCCMAGARARRNGTVGARSSPTRGRTNPARHCERLAGASHAKYAAAVGIAVSARDPTRTPGSTRFGGPGCSNRGRQTRELPHRTGEQIGAAPTVGPSEPPVWKRRPADPLSNAAWNITSFVENAGDHRRIRRRISDPVRALLHPSPAWFGQFRVGPRCSQTRGRVTLNPGGRTRDRRSEVPNCSRTLKLCIEACELLNIVLSIRTKRDQRGAVELSGS